MSLIDNICLKSIVGFRYLIDRPVSQQPHHQHSQNQRRELSTVNYQDLSMKKRPLLDMNDIINQCAVDDYIMIDIQ